MLIVDTHVHTGIRKYEPIEVILFQMERNGVGKAVLIQHRGETDNGYHLECVRRYPGRFVSVCLVDTDREDAPERLAYWAEQGVQGVRLWPTVRSPGSDPLAIWRKAAELGLVVSSLGRVPEFASDDFRGLVEALPDLPLVIEHLGGVGHQPDPPYTAYRKVLGLARYPNVYMKVGGFGEFCQEPFPFRQIPPVAEMALDAFGPTRLMWGSDYPPSGRREGYRNALQFPLEHIPFRSDADREWVFGRTALSLWRFEEAARA